MMKVEGTAHFEDNGMRQQTIASEVSHAQANCMSVGTADALPFADANFHAAQLAALKKY